MKHLISIILICALSSQAHAGFWESLTGFFDGGEETQQTPAVEVEEASATSTKETLTKTGLQLLPILMQTLGVSNGQAQGGMGAILQAAQVLLSQTQYGTLLGAIPGAQSLLAAAPAVTATDAGSLKGQLLSGAMDMAGKQGETLKQGADLVAQFKSLGLGADMIPKFTEATSTYLNKSDNPEAGQLLNTALSSFGTGG